MIITATGVYGNTEVEFFQKLIDAKITIFVDVRQRRGMRGSKYAFVNSTYLQDKLSELGISYIHIKALAPTTEIREAQKQARLCLGEKFIELYKEKVLNNFNFIDFLNQFEAEKVVFFCVEQYCSACHRKLILDKLKKDYKLNGYCF